MEFVYKNVFIYSPTTESELRLNYGSENKIKNSIIFEISPN